MSFLPFISDQLQQSAQIATSYFGKVSGTTKAGDNNQVLTKADIAIGIHLVQAIQQVYPNHNIIDEEAGGIDNGSNFTWVIDPIEATSNFAAGLPQYGIMLGLLKDDRPIAGGVIAPAYGKLYLAEAGGGATCNDQPITVIRETNLLNMLVSFGVDGHQNDPERTHREAQVIADVVLSIRNLRNSGCEATDTMYVAEGRFGGRIVASSRIWDNVAPQIICQEAGALWTDTNGHPIDYTNPFNDLERNFTFCTANPALHKQLIATVDGRLSQ